MHYFDIHSISAQNLTQLLKERRDNNDEWELGISLAENSTTFRQFVYLYLIVSLSQYQVKWAEILGWNRYRADNNRSKISAEFNTLLYWPITGSRVNNQILCIQCLTKSMGLMSHTSYQSGDAIASENWDWIDGFKLAWQMRERAKRW